MPIHVCICLFVYERWPWPDFASAISARYGPEINACRHAGKHAESHGFAQYRLGIVHALGHKSIRHFTKLT